MGRKTFHSKSGRFTSFNRANIVTQDGEKFKMVRTLEPIEPPDNAPDAATAEAVVQVKKKVADFANRIAPHWIALDEVVK